MSILPFPSAIGNNPDNGQKRTIFNGLLLFLYLPIFLFKVIGINPFVFEQ